MCSVNVEVISYKIEGTWCRGGFTAKYEHEDQGSYFFSHLLFPVGRQHGIIVVITGIMEFRV